MASAGMQALAGWGAMLVGMALSFVYSGLETGTYAVNKIRLELRIESGSRQARRLHSILRDPGMPLLVVLIGNNLANYLASAGMVLILTSRGVVRADWYSVAILTPVVFIFCELLPKNLFHRHGETLTYVLSAFLDLSRRVFAICGLVGLAQLMVRAVLRLAGRVHPNDDGPLHTGGRMAALLAEGQASGAITGTQSLIAQRVVNIDQVRLRDVMVPLPQAVVVPESVTAEGVREILAAHGHPRLGVFSGNRGRIVGTLNAYDVLMDPTGAPPSAHVEPAVELAEHTGVIEALVAMQTQRKNIAFVVADDRRCVGLVTVKDLVEEIVGELHEW